MFCISLNIQTNDFIYILIRAIPLVPRLRMRGTVPPLSHTSSWRDASLSIGTTLPYLLLTLSLLPIILHNGPFMRN
jgi:hypothetical protein